MSNEKQDVYTSTRLHAHHRQDHRRDGTGRPYLDEALECRKHGWANYPAIALQRYPLAARRDQCFGESKLCDCHAAGD